MPPLLSFKKKTTQSLMSVLVSDLPHSPGSAIRSSDSSGESRLSKPKISNNKETPHCARLFSTSVTVQHCLGRRRVGHVLTETFSCKSSEWSLSLTGATRNPNRRLTEVETKYTHCRNMEAVHKDIQLTLKCDRTSVNILYLRVHFLI